MFVRLCAFACVRVFVCMVEYASACVSFMNAFVGRSVLSCEFSCVCKSDSLRELVCILGLVRMFVFAFRFLYVRSCEFLCAQK